MPMLPAIKSSATRITRCLVSEDSIPVISLPAKWAKKSAPVYTVEDSAEGSSFEFVPSLIAGPGYPSSVRLKVLMRV